MDGWMDGWIGRMDVQNGWTINTYHETIVDSDQLLNLVISCFYKQCQSRSAGFSEAN